MAHAQRKQDRVEQGQPGAAATYQAGGPVADLHADLSQRLLATDGGMVAGASTIPGERLVRALSVSGGYLALTAGYAGAALVLAYLF